MEFPCIKPKNLDGYVNVATNFIQRLGDSTGFAKNEKITEYSDLLIFKDVSVQVFDYLISIKCIEAYQFEYSKNRNAPLKSIKLFNIDYPLVKIYSLNQSRILMWMIEAEQKGEPLVRNFWFKNDTLYYEGLELLFSGAQARLCEILFDIRYEQESINEQDIVEFITGNADDIIFDLKDSIKNVNLKIKKYFNISNNLIKRRNGKVFTQK